MADQLPLTDAVNVVPSEMIGTAELGEIEGLGNTDLDSLLNQDQIQFPQADPTFFDNLTPTIEDSELAMLGDQLIQMVDEDNESRAEYMNRYEKALESMNEKGGVNLSGETTESQKKLEKVKQTMLNEGVTHFNARAMAELLPPAGAVRAKIVGGGSSELMERSTRVVDFMNYQIDHNIDGYFETLDTLLTHLPLTGSAYKFVCWHPLKEKVDVEFVTAEDLIISPDSKSLESSPRFTHKIRMTRNEFNKLVEIGYYEDAPRAEGFPDTDDRQTESMKQVGIAVNDMASEEDDIISLYNVYTFHRFETIDNQEQIMLSGDIEIPYVITIEPTSKKVVGVRRNWNAFDDKFDPLQHFVSYKFLPGLTQVYGRGLYESIGGMDKAATNSLQALLDSAAYANSVTGFKREGAEGGQKNLKPGEMRQIRGGSNALNQDIMPIQFKEPSPTMFQLLGFLTEEGRRFAMTTDVAVGELSGNSNLPVGTITALIEQGQKQFSAIHKRLHNSQAMEFRIMVRLYRDNMPEVMEFTTEGELKEIYQADFDDRIDIIPVSDPNISSSTQRIVMAQELLQIAAQFPTIIQIDKVIMRMMEAMNVPNHEELLADNNIPLLDNVSENARAMQGLPIQVYPGQNHDAHIAVHIAFMEDPSMGSSPFGQEALLALQSHIRDHQAMRYKESAFNTLDTPIDPNMPLDPEIEYQLSTEFANLVSTTEPHEIPAITQMSQDPSIDMALQLAELEMQIKREQHNEDLIAKREKLKAELKAMEIKATTASDLQNRTGQEQNAVKIHQLNELHNQAMEQKDAELIQKLEHMEAEFEQKIEAMEAELRTKLLGENEAHIQKLNNDFDGQRGQLEKDKQELETEKNKLMNDLKTLRTELKSAKDELAKVKAEQNSKVNPPK